MSVHYSTSVHILGQSIIKHKDQITANARSTCEIASNEQKLPDVVPNTFYDHIVASLAESIEAGEVSYTNDDLPSFEEARRMTGLLESILMSVSSIKQALLNYIDEYSKEIDLTVSEVISITKLIDPLINEYLHYYTENHLMQAAQSLQAEYYQSDELSVPIIKISNRVAICPIIGDIDERRGNLILERTLTESSAKKIRTLILDLSGIETLDTMMTQHLFKIVDSLELMGVEIIVTGVSSEVAIGVVSLGLDLNALTIKQNLSDALQELGMIDS
ncbi:STAS domain-containing protein [Pseudalkalibacillus hwajinpoensis]|uniref:STAS domain-containing protein n=1 Tax=Guptibacillus hwajinpoensis TaxID=208199 RepID=A0A4U1MLQ3_9BACL|nr:STAS domain-containing protein [Pseudalkalibacillus hwajinpoensis]TKD72439.1 STAS domain-containing protein [Pseudalkalibacillus hwajinpoensis]